MYDMKSMTCKQLGGSCDLEFTADTFDEMAKISKNHGMEMLRNGDEAHLKAMSNMQNLMKTPGAFNEWMELKRKEFDLLPDSF